MLIKALVIRCFKLHTFRNIHIHINFSLRSLLRHCAYIELFYIIAFEVSTVDGSIVMLRMWGIFLQKKAY